ncbi:MAG: copper resistance protein CopC [Solirubrobacterales bacterium]|nr:copper resistance protein CopC [Solirubrobacterales bacterium]
MKGRPLLAVLVALVLPGVLAAQAGAHARLQSSSPARDVVLKTQPATVVFRFDEAVEGRFGAIKVFDAQAERVDRGATDHPAGQQQALQVKLRPGLAQGTYTATYRVVSADGHPVEGGVVFSVGRRGALSSKTIDELIGSRTVGPFTRIPFGVARSLDLLTLALGIGLSVFLLACWRPALAATRWDGDEDWEAAATAVGARARRLLLITAAAGGVVTILGLVFEGATASGGTFWQALEPSTVRDVLATRFGTAWQLKGLLWVVLASVLLTGAPAWLPLLPALGLAVTPALSGHAATSGHELLVLPSDVLHVVAMSVWLGGLAALLLLVPRATARLPEADRSRLLAAVLVRFSPLALACVVALVATGTLQSIVYLTGFGDLVGDAFGRAVLVKIALLLGLIALAGVNRQRVLPRLRALAAGGETPGATGHLLRRTLRAEVLTLFVVLGVTGALVGYAPPSSTADASGPVNVSKRLGPLDLEVTVEPARVGANTMHLYLFDATDGTPFVGTKELRVTARLASRDVGPLPLTLRRTGPGHFTADRFTLLPGGRWTFAVTERVSDFDQYETSFSVKVAR